MSKKIRAIITCPYCMHKFEMELYRSIWGEFPENRDLVLSDKINVAHCPKCNQSTKLDFSLLYTNPQKQIAIWWEPEFDPDVEKDEKEFKKNLPNTPLANAPRIRDWNNFKEKIIELENKNTIVNQKRFGRLDYLGYCVLAYLLTIIADVFLTNIGTLIYRLLYLLSIFISLNAAIKRGRDIGWNPSLTLSPLVLYILSPFLIGIFTGFADIISLSIYGWSLIIGCILLTRKGTHSLNLKQKHKTEKNSKSQNILTFVSWLGKLTYKPFKFFLIPEKKKKVF